MQKNRVIFILIFLLFSMLILAREPQVLPELTRPAILIVKNEKIFVLQDTTVFIYNLRDYRLIAKFGKAGEGPGEFKINPNDGRPMSMAVVDNRVMVNSIAKLSCFAMDGTYLSEKRLPVDALMFPIKEKFVAIGPVSDKEHNRFLGFRLMESSMKEWKTLYLSKLNMSGRMQRLLLPIVNITYNPVYKDKIYINSSLSEFLIDVFDAHGEKLYSIRKDYKNIPVPGDYKQKCLAWFKTSPKFRRQYEFIKNILDVRGYFPSIRDLQLADDIIHVITYRRKGELWECVLLDLKGRELGRRFIPLAVHEPLSFYPILYSSYKGNMYTLVENEDDENWEIYETPLK